MRTDERAIYAHGFDEDVQQNDHNTCPECDGRVTTDRHETVCEDCGLVLTEKKVDRGPEWRSFEEDTKRRTGPSRTVARHDNGLSTEIGHDWNGGGVSRERRQQFRRLRTQHDRSKFESKRDRNRAHAFTGIRRLTGALGLGEDRRDQACALFAQAQDADLLRGRSIKAIASASVYAVCRCHGLPRSLAEVAAASQVSRSKVTNAYSVLNEELRLPTQPVEPSAYVPRLASALDVSQAVERRARELVGQA